MVRASALRAGIRTILSAPLEKEGEVSALRIGHDLVNRVNILGMVVSFQPSMLMLDDGSGTIAVQWFEGGGQVQVGDLVLVIGRVREFNERYVVPEILRKISDRRWVEVRRRELELNAAVLDTKESGEEREVGMDGADDPEERALKMIHEKDRGDGADMDEVIELLGGNGEEIVKRLLMAGEVFEAKPGRLRLL